MSEWGFYCDVETGHVLETPYIFTAQTCNRIGLIHLLYSYISGLTVSSKKYWWLKLGWVPP